MIAVCAVAAVWVITLAVSGYAAAEAVRNRD